MRPTVLVSESENDRESEGVEQSEDEGYDIVESPLGRLRKLSCRERSKQCPQSCRRGVNSISNKRLFKHTVCSV